MGYSPTHLAWHPNNVHAILSIGQTRQFQDSKRLGGTLPPSLIPMQEVDMHEIDGTEIHRYHQALCPAKSMNHRIASDNPLQHRIHDLFTV